MSSDDKSHESEKQENIDEEQKEKGDSTMISKGYDAAYKLRPQRKSKFP